MIIKKVAFSCFVWNAKSHFCFAESLVFRSSFMSLADRFCSC